MRKVLKVILSCMLIPLLWIRNRILTFLLRLRGQLRIRSLRQAIGDADKDKDQTGRKNMVVFNTASGEYEPIQKRLLKAASRSGKNKSNKAMTPGRMKMMKKQKARVLSIARVHTIEKKSLYVTK
jgi:hypothetical protein